MSPLNAFFLLLYFKEDNYETDIEVDGCPIKVEVTDTAGNVSKTRHLLGLISTYPIIHGRDQKVSKDYQSNVLGFHYETVCCVGN